MLSKNFLIPLIESLYVIFMLNFFKTKYSLAHPLTYFENKLLYHPIGKSEKPVSNICKLGNIGAYFIAAFIIFRFFIDNFNTNKILQKNIKLLSIFVLLLVFITSLLNFNAVVYLIPYFVYELIYVKNR